jgi:hypothetical protein
MCIEDHYEYDLLAIDFLKNATSKSTFHVEAYFRKNNNLIIPTYYSLCDGEDVLVMHPSTSNEYCKKKNYFFVEDIKIIFNVERRRKYMKIYVEYVKQGLIINGKVIEEWKERKRKMEEERKKKEEKKGLNKRKLVGKNFGNGDGESNTGKEKRVRGDLEFLSLNMRNEEHGDYDHFATVFLVNEFREISIPKIKGVFFSNDNLIIPAYISLCEKRKAKRSKFSFGLRNTVKYESDPNKNQYFVDDMNILQDGRLTEIYINEYKKRRNRK